MDKRADRTVALMSIHPVYAKRLLDGSKCVEFRKTRLSSDIRYVVIYATAPIKRVVGYFSVKQIVIDTPTEIWFQYRRVAGIGQSEFHEYYEGSMQAVAIEVAQMHVLSRPKPISVMADNTRPPQSYQYFGNKVIKTLSRYKTVKRISAA